MVSRPPSRFYIFGSNVFKFDAKCLVLYRGNVPFDLKGERADLILSGFVLADFPERVKETGLPLLLLRALIWADGGVVSKKELERKLWGKAKFDNSLSIALDSLRKLVKDAVTTDNRPAITIKYERPKGYRLIGPDLRAASIGMWIGPVGELLQPLPSSQSDEPAGRFQSSQWALTDHVMQMVPQL